MHSQCPCNHMLLRRLGACLLVLGHVLVSVVPAQGSNTAQSGVGHSAHGNKAERHHAPRSFDGSALACKTCIFPNSAATASSTHQPGVTLDFTDKWIYFLGDVTLRQVYGEVAAAVANAQVGSQHVPILTPILMLCPGNAADPWALAELHGVWQTVSVTC